MLACGFSPRWLPKNLGNPGDLSRLCLRCAVSGRVFHRPVPVRTSLYVLLFELAGVVLVADLGVCACGYPRKQSCDPSFWGPINWCEEEKGIDVLGNLPKVLGNNLWDQIVWHRLRNWMLLQSGNGGRQKTSGSGIRVTALAPYKRRLLTTCTCEQTFGREKGATRSIDQTVKKSADQGSYAGAQYIYKRPRGRSVQQVQLEHWGNLQCCFPSDITRRLLSSSWEKAIK